MKLVGVKIWNVKNHLPLIKPLQNIFELFSVYIRPLWIVSFEIQENFGFYQSKIKLDLKLGIFSNF
jgi:hypothetical protein